MYVVIGANGFLGSYIIKSILDKTNDKIIAVGRNVREVHNESRVTWMKCDISDISDVQNLADKMKNGDSHNVIYLAAYHHPDMVEQNPKTAWNINVTSLAAFLNLIDNVRCLFYPSTDSVYGDSDNNYHFKESDKLNPVNRYGKHKVAAECLINAYGYNVVRYPFLIAPSLTNGKKHFYDQIVNSITQGRKMEMFVDSMRSSLDFGTAAELLVDLIINYNESIPKILNLSGDDDLSKYDIGLMIAKKIGVSENLIVPICSDDSNNIFEVKRAKSTLLDNTLVKKTLGLEKISIKL